MIHQQPTSNSQNLFDDVLSTSTNEQTLSISPRLTSNQLKPGDIIPHYKFYSYLYKAVILKCPYPKPGNLRQNPTKKKQIQLYH